jgi:adenylate cyclase
VSESAAKAADEWRKLLIEGHQPLWLMQHIFRFLPSAPRCKVCHNPFAGLGGTIVGWFGFTRSRKNPQLCSRCCDGLPVGGAEVETAILFADIRGSSRIAADDGPVKFAQKLNRFYAEVTEILVRHDAIIDKMIGDEVMALFVPGIAGADFRTKAVAAALDLTHRFGLVHPHETGIAVGAAVHCGPAYVGNVGSDYAVDLTALGETVNLAAHLQAAAGPGELLLTSSARDASKGRFPKSVERSVMLKGRTEPLSVFAIAPSQGRVS